MVVLGIVVCALIVGGFTALYVWTRRSERDIDYTEMRDKSTQSDDQRRVEQLGIGLTSGPSITGPQ